MPYFSVSFLPSLPLFFPSFPFASLGWKPKTMQCRETDSKIQIDPIRTYIFSFLKLWMFLNFKIFFIIFQILFPFRLLKNIEQVFLSCAVGPCWLSVLNIAVWIYQSQTPGLSLLPTPPPGTINSPSKSMGLSLFRRQVHLYPLFRSHA